MIELILMLFIGIILLCFALFALRRPPRIANEDGTDSEAQLLSMLRLPSLEFDATNLFSDADYHLLASEPKLRSVARELRKDRKGIALQWLAELQKDVFSMWRLRSFLTRLGVGGMPDEFSQAVRSLSLLCLLSVVRACVRLLGPHVFSRAAVSVRNNLGQIERSCAATLGNLPRERWPQIAAEWQRAQSA